MQLEPVVHFISSLDTVDLPACEEFEDRLKQYFQAFSLQDQTCILPGEERASESVSNLMERMSASIGVLWDVKSGILPKEYALLIDQCRANTLAVGCRYHPNSIVNYAKKNRFKNHWFQIRQLSHRLFPEKKFGIIAAHRSVWSKLANVEQNDMWQTASNLNIDLIRVGVMWGVLKPSASVKQ